MGVPAVRQNLKMPCQSFWGSKAKQPLQNRFARPLFMFCLALALVPFQYTIAQTIYFVPNDFPGSDRIHIVEDGQDERFCSLELEGLDYARTRLGFTPCNSSLPRSGSQLSLARRSHNIDALLLVDDRSQLSPEAVRLLSGAIQQSFGSNYYVVPFGLELRSSRTILNNSATLPAGFKAMVVGERLYRDHYTNLASGELMWLGNIDANIRAISAPDYTLAPAEIDSDTAAREVFLQATQHFDTGEFERAFWLYLDLTRVPGLERPTLAANLVLTIAAQGGDAYLKGDYQLAFDSWQRFMSHTYWLGEDVVAQLNEAHLRTYMLIKDRQDVWSADALLKMNSNDLAAELYSSQIMELAQAANTATEIREALPVLTRLHPR